jgi:hypothetical protein
MGHSLLSTTLRSVAAASLLAACGGSDSDLDGKVTTAAPRCSDLTDADAKALFGTPVIPTTSVLESLIFGGMDPGTLEPINFELGFRLTGMNVPVTAPTDLYVNSIASTKFISGWRAGETDYAVTFHVCSEDKAGTAEVAVEGDFAHVTSLEPALLAALASGQQECNTNAGPEETVETCRRFFAATGDDALVIAEGESIGSAGGTGATDYRPGFDFNLLDTRFPNEFVNPDRLGAEEGPGRWFRYGACVYDYFTGATGTAYMSKVGQNGDLRTMSGDPCGRLSIDKAGTAAGVWIRADKADLDINTDWVGVLQNLLVLAPHPVFPGQREVVSSELLSIASHDGDGLLVEFAQTDVGEVNRSFYEMTPGPIHCIEGSGFGIPDPHHYYVQVGPAGDTLTIERLASGCDSTPTGSRAFGPGAIQFVR